MAIDAVNQVAIADENATTASKFAEYVKEAKEFYAGMNKEELIQQFHALVRGGLEEDSDMQKLIGMVKGGLVEVDAKTKGGSTALGIAVIQQSEEMVITLLELGANPNAKIYFQDNHNSISAIDAAIVQGDVKTTAHLLKHGAKPNKDVQQVLEIAAEKNPSQEQLDKAKEIVRKLQKDFPQLEEGLDEETAIKILDKQKETGSKVATMQLRIPEGIAGMDPKLVAKINADLANMGSRPAPQTSGAPSTPGAGKGPMQIG